MNKLFIVLFIVLGFSGLSIADAAVQGYDDIEVSDSKSEGKIKKGTDDDCDCLNTANHDRKLTDHQNPESVVNQYIGKQDAKDVKGTR